MGDIKRKRLKWRCEHTCTSVLFIFTTFSFSVSPLGYCVLCKDVLSFVFQTFDFQVLCFGFCVLCPVLLNGAMET